MAEFSATTTWEEWEDFARVFARALDYGTPDASERHWNAMPQYNFITGLLRGLAESDAALQSVWIGLGLAPDRMEAEYPKMRKEVARDA